MSGAIPARQLGDNYQSLVFWKYANMMLKKGSEIEKIVFEDDVIKSFDDIVVYYAKPRMFRSSDIDRDYIQVKFNMAKEKMFTIDNLLDPSFINAKKYSLLDRVVEAYRNLGDEFKRCRFIIYSIRDIDPSDELYRLVDNVESIIRLDILYDGKTRSKMAKIRKNLSCKLGVSEDELSDILSQVCLYTGMEKYNEIIEVINRELQYNGLKPYKPSSYYNPYIHLVQCWNQRGVNEFNRSGLIGLLKKEELFAVNRNEECVGVKSFTKGTKDMNERVSSLLDLSEYFSERVPSNGEWKNICCKLDDFIERLYKDKRYTIELETHQSIAFALGKKINPVLGLNITPIQKTISGQQEWKANISLSGHYPELTENIYSTHEGKDTLIALSISNDICEDVKRYIEENKLSINLTCFLNMPDIGVDAVRNEEHAWSLVKQIDSVIRMRMREIKKGTIHLFASCPNAILFNWGRMARLYDVQLYEFDRKKHTYYPTIKLS